MTVKMLIRSLVFALAFCLVVQPAVYAQEQAPAQQQSTSQPDQNQAATAAQPHASADVKAQMKRIGNGNQAIVIFTDGSTQAGRIKKLDKTTFALNEGKSNGSYSYADVSTVSTPRPSGSSVGAKVMPIAFLASGVLVVAGMVDFAVTKAKGASSGSSATANPAR
jgi:hypothetical protein